MVKPTSRTARRREGGSSYPTNSVYKIVFRSLRKILKDQSTMFEIMTEPY